MALSCEGLLVSDGPMEEKGLISDLGQPLPCDTDERRHPTVNVFWSSLLVMQTNFPWTTNDVNPQLIYTAMLCRDPDRETPLASRKL